MPDDKKVLVAPVCYWELVERSSLQLPTAQMLIPATPLLEEERDSVPATLLEQLQHPRLLEWSRARSTLTSGNDPIHAGQIDRTVTLGAAQRTEI